MANFCSVRKVLSLNDKSSPNFPNETYDDDDDDYDEDKKNNTFGFRLWWLLTDVLACTHTHNASRRRKVYTSTACALTWHLMFHRKYGYLLFWKPRFVFMGCCVSLFCTRITKCTSSKLYRNIDYRWLVGNRWACNRWQRPMPPSTRANDRVRKIALNSR